MQQRLYLIGLDEAGYGPNLGPLVVGATVWSVSAEGSVESLWSQLAAVVTEAPGRRDRRLHLADSKLVNKGASGLGGLERGVLSCLWAMQQAREDSASSVRPACWRSLIEHLQGRLPETFARQPWYENQNFALPVAVPAGEPAEQGAALSRVMELHEIRLEQMAIELICPERFNREVTQRGNKGGVLSHTTFRLLQRVWPQGARQVHVLADKHGGRNRYQSFLNEYFPGELFMQEVESQQESRYRQGNIRLSFATGSERHLPVALASMTAKYLRELCLTLFNAYWIERQPGLKPTKGYPTDARRFCQEIASLLEETPELRPLLWRER